MLYCGVYAMQSSDPVWDSCLTVVCELDIVIWRAAGQLKEKDSKKKEQCQSSNVLTIHVMIPCLQSYSDLGCCSFISNHFFSWALCSAALQLQVHLLTNMYITCTTRQRQLHHSQAYGFMQHTSWLPSSVTWHKYKRGDTGVRWWQEAKQMWLVHKSNGRWGIATRIDRLHGLNSMLQHRLWVRARLLLLFLLSPLPPELECPLAVQVASFSSQTQTLRTFPLYCCLQATALSVYVFVCNTKPVQ